MRALLLFVMFMTCSSGFASEQVPKLLGRVNDYAGVLTHEENKALEATLWEHEKATTNQIVVLTVPTLGDDDIFSFSQSVYDSWKLGQKGKDNGALVVMVKDRLERGKSTRIHPGRGLEGALPDVVCRHIVVDEMKPLLLQGKYADGLRVGVSSIFAKVVHEYARDVPKVDAGILLALLGLVLGISGAVYWFGFRHHRRLERSMQEDARRNERLRQTFPSSRSGPVYPRAPAVQRQVPVQSSRPVDRPRPDDSASFEFGDSNNDSTPDFSGGGGESAGGGGGD